MVYRSPLPHCYCAKCLSLPPFVCQSFISVNKFLLANQVKWVQIPIPYCPHMFHHAPLPHCYCTKCIFLPPIWPPIIHICEQPSPAYQVGSNPHCPSSYVLPGPIAPLLLRQVGILASLLHANHSCLWTSFSLQIKSGGVKSPFPTVPICSAGPEIVIFPCSGVKH